MGGALPGRMIAASCITAPRHDPTARRGARRKKLVWWDGAEAGVDGTRQARLPPAQAAGQRPTRTPPASTRSTATSPSSCTPTASAGSTWHRGFKDGPLPAHYEPLESPVANRAVSQRSQSSGADRKSDRTTLTRSRRMIRATPTCSRPTGSPNITPQAACRGRSRTWPSCSRSSSARSRRTSRRRSDVENGEWVDASPRRAAPSTHARSSRGACGRSSGRGTRIVHQVGLPYHFGGHRGLVRGDVVNDLVADLGRAERQDHGSQGLVCNLFAGDGQGVKHCRNWHPVWKKHERNRLPHRLDAVHRLQGLRGRVQGVERRSRRRVRVHADSRTTTPRASATRRGGT